jgi:hypothetical protein
MLRVLIKASELPDGQVVTKRNGEKRYTLRHAIHVHGSGDIPSQQINADKGARFLVSSNGDVNAISNAMEVLAELDFDLLYDLEEHQRRG